jgi:hypothetical protein
MQSLRTLGKYILQIAKEFMLHQEQRRAPIRGIPHPAPNQIACLLDAARRLQQAAS